MLNVRCPECGFAAVVTRDLSSATGNFNLIEFTKRCKVVTGRVSGEHPSLTVSDCPNFLGAMAAAAREQT